MEKYDPSQLTEFPKFEPEAPQSGVSSFFNKLLRFPIFSGTEDNENNQDNAEQIVVTPGADTDDNNEDNKLEAAFPAIPEARSLQNVLRRISSLVALGSGGGTRYADTELARYWMPDDISRECYECATRFSALRRRHHCRVCGQIFCNRCCSQRVPGHIFGCAGGLRVCTYCSNVVLSYLQEHELSGDMTPDLKTLQEDLQVKFPENKSNEQPRRDFIFAGDATEHEERGDLRPCPKESIQDVFQHMSSALPTSQHRYRLVRYNGVWRGCDILQWIMDHTQYKTRDQATTLCQQLIIEGYIDCIADLPKFADYTLYKPKPFPPLVTQDNSPDDSPRLVESVSSYCLDLNVGDSSARLIKATKPENTTSPAVEEESPVIQHAEPTTEPKKVCKVITESGEDHLKLLLRQCLARQGLQSSWLDVILPLCMQASQIIAPEPNSNDIDIRNYVQIKKVATGTYKDSCVVPGVVLTKNVIHRGMPQDLVNPSILLLHCSIAYQRVEGKLTSLEPLLLQEQEYLVRCAARISALKPNVVLVRGTAARTVQDELRKEGMALATGVGERALRRVCRLSAAEMVSSVDARVCSPTLGTCRRFYLKNFAGKTLMFFEGCAKPNLGCCILLHGSSINELIRVKQVVKFFLLACYNWKLEHAFLNDIEAVLPDPGNTFDDDIDEELDNKNNDETEEECPKTDKQAIETDGDIETEVNEPIVQNTKKEVSKTDESEGSRNKTDETVMSKSKNDEVFVRKSDDRTLSSVPIRDFSDPLRSSQLSVDDDVFLPKEETRLKTDNTVERWSADDTVLSISPNVIISTPFLETEAGRKCGLRQYFCTPLFTSVKPKPHVTPNAARKYDYSESNAPRVPINDLHPFLKNPITKPIDDLELRASLAHFRAVGSTYKDAHLPNCPLANIRKIENRTPEEEQPHKVAAELDPLSPENHQKLSLLLYSFCEKSANVPDFCVNPWIVTMELYGRHDISLGTFLEKYCFNNDYKCPSSTCHVPMNQHARRFVHGESCITITCNTIGHSSDKLNQMQTNQIMFWSRCPVCSTSSRGTRLSAVSRRLSLARYLQLRHCPARLRTHCRHPLSIHTHYFHTPTTTACFRYNKITSWEIAMPPKMIATHYDTKVMRDHLISQVNDLMLRGHDILGAIECDITQEQANFKQQMENIHVALTSDTLQQQLTPAGVVKFLWSIGDRVILAEKLLRDTHDKYAPNCKINKAHIDNSVEEKVDLDDSSDTNSADIIDPLTKEVEHQGVEDDEEKGDKKSVRQLLSQLLSNNQPCNQHGVIISGGVIPVVVFSGEIGSVIAATLVSVQYQRSLQALLANNMIQTQSDQEDCETPKEKVDGDKPKAAKSNEHIEILLKDGLQCRVYYAAQFQKLRSMVLSPLNTNPNIKDDFSIGNTETQNDVPNDSKTDDKEKNDNKWWCNERNTEEGFARSLAFCEPWAARGGKSGSTFCKTKDDRFVLKEMSKPEWQQFLEFAPHYFAYVINCHQNKLPTLLARIVGVFSVGGAGDGVLVMENLLYNQPMLKKRFDLKGSSRHRLMQETHDAVLMDENLLHLRWENQLYLQSHSAQVLWAAVERDTQFLATHCVMDYSLLLGISDTCLVLGIIDYIRTFTWDKKLEHYVKKNLGSGQPTVVSPEQYKRRFCAAMRKYFMHCPSQWDGLHRGLTHPIS